MPLSNWLRKFIQSASPLHPQGAWKRPSQRALAIELLAERSLPSVFTVTSLADSGPGTLRDVWNQVIASTETTNTINFSVTGTIQLQTPLNTLSRSGKTVDVAGPGASSLTVERAAGTPAMGGFSISGSDNVTISGLTMATFGLPTDGGGAITTWGGAVVTVNDCVFTHNDSGTPTAVHNGGAIYADNGTLHIHRSTFSDNFGEALWAQHETLTVDDSTFTGNTASGGENGFGAALGVAGGLGANTATVSRCTFGDNTAGGNGGAVWIGAGSTTRLSITDSTFANNSAGAAGGAIWMDPASTGDTLTVTTSTFVANTAVETGGIWSVNTTTIADSTFTDNSSTGGTGGGAVWIEPTPGPETTTVTGSTFWANTADGPGGAFWGAGTETIVNSTFTMNSASGGGGAIYVNAGFTSIKNCTITGNSLSGGNGSGVFTETDRMQGDALPTYFFDTIIAGDVIAPGVAEVEGPVDGASAYSIFGDGSPANLVNGVNDNQLGTADAPIDPRLRPLADNGGPTLTLALRHDSPARNAGSIEGVPATDQRGLPRIVNGRIDIGAYEHQSHRGMPPLRNEVSNGPANIAIPLTDDAVPTPQPDGSGSPSNAANTAAAQPDPFRNVLAIVNEPAPARSLVGQAEGFTPDRLAVRGTAEDVLGSDNPLAMTLANTW